MLKTFILFFSTYKYKKTVLTKQWFSFIKKN